MAVEIERKFLLQNDAWRVAATSSQRMQQGYLGGERCSVRVRVAGEQAFLNIKSATMTLERQEFEYAIPLDDGQAMLESLCGAGRIDKIRHLVPFGGRIFEVDEFLGENAGLVVAELELEHRDAPFERPAWLGREVSEVSRYFNVALLRHPYANWTAAEKD